MGEQEAAMRVAAADAADTIRVALVTGQSARVARGTSVGDALVALGVAPGEGERRLLAAESEGRTLELFHPLQVDTALRPLTFDEPRGRLVLRHTAAHTLAQAVKRLWPGARLGTGPATEDGFFYDVAFPEPIGADALPAIEREMQAIVAADYPVVRKVVDRDEALALFTARDEPYKVELIRALPPEATVTVYTQGEFVDLCRGPHVPSTGYVQAFALTSLAGAYWRGDESRPMLQRIHGTAFPTQEALERQRAQMEEAARRDHRRLGRELGLFALLEEAPGSPFWLPRGVVVLNLLTSLMRRLQELRGYQELRTPQLLSSALWLRSGHWEHYRENMFVVRNEDGEFAVKPMNCPAAFLLFSQGLHSYRELPLRYMDFGGLHRNERSGTLHGLMRARAFVQDDAHLFVTPEGIGAEIRNVLDLVRDVYAIFGLPYHLELSTRPENSMGSDALWERAEAGLRGALEELGLDYAVNPGDGAFYGPKIDVHVEDSLGRRWQCGTVQLDFQMPERFELEYVGADGHRHRPVIIHRAILGSLERFVGILIEHYGGAFPTWLAPVQVRVLPVAERHVGAAHSLADALRRRGLRPEVDGAAEKLGRRIRQAELDKLPYMAVIGDREAEARTVSLRGRGQGDLGAVSWDALVERLEAESGVDGVGRLC
jgi:threonyl-tRNA synthetase